jgi:GntR family transcriptional regulator of vanillate catabolism
MKKTSRNAAGTAAAEDDADARRAEPATVTVLTRVRELIVTGDISPGTRLAAETVAHQLGVSRTPVRSALAVLSAEGLVSYEMNRGYTVRKITVRDVLDAVGVRAVLEGLGCGLSVDYGWSPESLGDLRTVVEAGRQIVDAKDWSEKIERHWYALNRSFHQQITVASHNAALRNAIRMTLIYPLFGDIARLSPAVAAFVPQRHRTIPESTPDHIVDSQLDHESILEAIEAGSAAGAQTLMQEHVLKSKARLEAAASRR